MHALFSGLAAAEAADSYLRGDAAAPARYHQMMQGIYDAYQQRLAFSYSAEMRWLWAPFSATPSVRGLAPAVAQRCCAVGYDDREDDQVDRRVKNQGAAEHLDQHADGVSWLDGNFSRARRSLRRCLVRRYPPPLVPPSRLAPGAGILDGIEIGPAHNPSLIEDREPKPPWKVRNLVLPTSCPSAVERGLARRTEIVSTVVVCWCSIGAMEKSASDRTDRESPCRKVFNFPMPSNRWSSLSRKRRRVRFQPPYPG